MLLKVDVLHRAWMSAIGGSKGEDFSSSKSGHPKTRTILLSPQGALFTSGRAKELASGFEKIIFVCGHYEGVDERFIELCVDEELSIGNYVLTGGEIPAMVIADSISRLVSGVIEKAEAVADESFENGLLEYPHYTKPAVFEDLTVPEVLISGHHGKVGEWRQNEKIKKTAKNNPKLS
jgi:tRNA (guanine37-N1)-methyltransferase